MVTNTHLLNGHMLKVHIEIAWQFQCVPTTYATEIKETYFEIYTNQVPVHWLSSFKHLKLPISIKIPVTIWQIADINMTAISQNLIS